MDNSIDENNKESDLDVSEFGSFSSLSPLAIMYDYLYRNKDDYYFDSDDPDFQSFVEYQLNHQD